MIEIPVSSVATDRAPVVEPTTSIVDAATHLRRTDVPAIVVADSDERVVGIVTESDIVAVVAERGGDRRVDSFMSSPVITAPPATPIGIAADRMRDAGVATLPVVDQEGTYHGLVTREALSPYLSRHRLQVEWKNDPLSLGGGEASEDATAARKT